MARPCGRASLIMCELRKVEPLIAYSRASTPDHRYQGGSVALKSGAKLIEWDQKFPFSKSPTLAKWTWRMSGPTSASTRFPTTNCMTATIPASAAPLHKARVPREDSRRDGGRICQDGVRITQGLVCRCRNLLPGLPRGRERLRISRWDEAKRAMKRPIEGRPRRRRVGAFHGHADQDGVRHQLRQ